MIWWVICGNLLRIGLKNAFFVGNSCGKFLWKNLVGNSCGKISWENLAVNSCGKFLWENFVGNSCGKILQEILVGNVAGKYSFLKPILNRLSHMTHQIEA